MSVRQWCILVASLAVWSWKAFSCVDHLTCSEIQEELIFGATMSLNLSIPLRQLVSHQIVVFDIKKRANFADSFLKRTNFT